MIWWTEIGKNCLAESSPGVRRQKESLCNPCQDYHITGPIKPTMRLHAWWKDCMMIWLLLSTFSSCDLLKKNIVIDIQGSVIHGPMDWQTDRWTDRLIEMQERTDRRMDRRKDRPSYRHARTPLKISCENIIVKGNWGNESNIKRYDHICGR